MSPHDEFLRKRITALRLQKKVSELQMSHDLGKSDGYIHQITSGRMKPSMDNFFEICSYFSVTPAEFWDADNPYPDQLRELADCVKRLPPEIVQTFITLARCIPAEGREHSLSASVSQALPD